MLYFFAVRLPGAALGFPAPAGPPTPPANLLVDPRSSAAGPGRTAAAGPGPRELTLLLMLAAVQFTHIVDFMIMMPLGPQFMRLFGIDPREFGLLVSVYTFAAAASGFVAAFWIDRFDRKRALLGLYAGFIVATALCGFAPNYAALLAARVVAGAFGGVLGGLVLRHRRRSRSLRAAGERDGDRRRGVFAGLGGGHPAARSGWPRGSRGARRSWSWRWPASRSRRWRCGMLPPMRSARRSRRAPASAGPAARDLRRRATTAGVRADDRADVRRLHGDPVHRPVQRRQRRHFRSRPRRHLLRRRARDAGHRRRSSAGSPIAAASGGCSPRSR